MRILVMGLPGSGKTTLAVKLASMLDYRHVNADQIRELYNDWDFSRPGRIKQAVRMNAISKIEHTICDFICPTDETRGIFDADFTIWMNTIEFGRYEDTNDMFEQPTVADLELKSLDYDVEEIFKIIKQHKMNKYNMITG